MWWIAIISRTKIIEIRVHIFKMDLLYWRERVLIDFYQPDSTAGVNCCCALEVWVCDFRRSTFLKINKSLIHDKSGTVQVFRGLLHSFDWVDRVNFHFIWINQRCGLVFLLCFFREDFFWDQLVLVSLLNHVVTFGSAQSCCVII